MNRRNISKVIIWGVIVFCLGFFVRQQIMNYKQVKVKESFDETTVAVATEEKVAPPFTLETLAGETVSLAQLKGKKVVVNFWATWCPPCQEEMPALQSYYEQADDVEVLAINLTHTESGNEAVQRFVQQYKLTFPILLTPSDEVQQQYEVLTIPSTFFINTDGVIQRQFVGPLTSKQLATFVQELK